MRATQEALCHSTAGESVQMFSRAEIHMRPRGTLCQDTSNLNLSGRTAPDADRDNLIEKFLKKGTSRHRSDRQPRSFGGGTPARVARVRATSTVYTALVDRPCGTPEPSKTSVTRRSYQYAMLRRAPGRGRPDPVSPSHELRTGRRHRSHDRASARTKQQSDQSDAQRRRSPHRSASFGNWTIVKSVDYTNLIGTPLHGVRPLATTLTRLCYRERSR